MVKLSTVIRKRAADCHEAAGLFIVMMNAVERGDLAKARHCKEELSARNVFVRLGHGWFHGKGARHAK